MSIARTRFQGRDDEPSPTLEIPVWTPEEQIPVLPVENTTLERLPVATAEITQDLPLTGRDGGAPPSTVPVLERRGR